MCLNCCNLASLIAQLIKNPSAMKETLVQFWVWEDLLEKGSATHSSILGLPLWLIKNLRACGETWVQSLRLGRSPGEGKVTHSSILAWRIPWTA